MPLPSELPDSFGGVTIEVTQCDWGHPTRKRTWLYIVGVRLACYPRMLAREPTHSICNGRGQRLADGTQRSRATALQARLTPPAFADYLVSLARLVSLEQGQSSSLVSTSITTGNAGGSFSVSRNASGLKG